MKQDELPLAHGLETPLVVNAGIGVNSTALLVELKRQGIRPDIVVFADVGDERPSTYAYIPVLNEWLDSVGFPQITTVRYQVGNFKNWPPYHTLGENCLTNGTLPGIAFGPKSCSVKWKRTPIEKHLKEHPAIKPLLAVGGRFTQYIGYDAGPPDLRRRKVADTITDKLADQEYPLQTWGWDRMRCIKEIAKEGLMVPDKSSCTFCTAMKPFEVESLPKRELRKIVAMESRYFPRMKLRQQEVEKEFEAAMLVWNQSGCIGKKPRRGRTVEGLWVSPVKGMRGAVPKPGNMTDYIRDTGLLDQAEIEFILETVPREIIAWQDAHKNGTLSNDWSLFFDWLNLQCEQLNEHALPAAS